MGAAIYVCGNFVHPELYLKVMECRIDILKRHLRLFVGAASLAFWAAAAAGSNYHKLPETSLSLVCSKII